MDFFGGGDGGLVVAISVDLVVVMDMAVDDIGDFFLVVLAKVGGGGPAGDHALVFLFFFSRKLRV